MSDTLDHITLQDVLDALSELRAGRSRGRWVRLVRSIMARYGDGARHPHELDPRFYEAVYTAAGGDVIAAEKIYGSVVDLPPAVPVIAGEDFYGVVLDVPKLKSSKRPKLRLANPLRAELQARLAAAPRSSARILSPLVADLEAKLKARAGKPRSKPNYTVNVGNPARQDDRPDDGPQPQYPNDGRRMS